MNVAIRHWLTLAALGLVPLATGAAPAYGQTATSAAAHSASQASQELALSRGIVLYKSGQHADALRALEEAGRNNPLALRYRGLVHLKRDDYEAAEAEFRAADLPVSAPVSKGLHLLGSGDLISAEQRFDEHLLNHPDDAGVQWLLAAVRS